MSLRKGDELIGMDILPSSVVDNIVAADEGELDEDETTIATEESEEEVETTSTEAGPWVLTITTGGYGKRVPVGQFRLQNRAGKGTIATKFKSHSKNDRLAGLHVVNEEDELMLVTSRGIIIRQVVKAISPQSRSATGVRVQRLDKDDAIAAVALVPPSAEDGDEMEGDD